ncbi:MAG: PQQ-dependent sugar dehydrogenase, partial [Candidatus Levybacteria bacterium]|nr:PQQ-dependent sugar dehydrogenase [Candidatus Levybacteria bacterium]
MRWYSIIGTVVLLCVGVWFVIFRQNTSPTSFLSRSQQPTPTADVYTAVTTVIAESLDTPWAITFLPDGSMLITEREGRVLLVDNSGNLTPNLIAEIEAVKEIGEGGLLGIAVHPNFSANEYVYLYYTYSSTGNNTLNRVVRVKYENGRLLDEKVILDKIPGASNHNGGRIKFGPDGLLYIGTGDAENPSQAQSTRTLGG